MIIRSLLRLRPRLIELCCFLIGMGSVAGAQQTPLPVTTTLQSSLTALSGKTNVQDITIWGNVTAGPESGTIELRATSAGQSRIDLNLTNGSKSELRSMSSDGPSGTWYGADQIAHPISQHNQLYEAAWFVPNIVIARLMSTSNVVNYLGQETKSKALALHFTGYQQLPAISNPLATQPKHLSQIDVYLDPSTWLPTVVSFNIHPDSDASVDIPVEIHFSDYKATNGILLPHSIQKYLNNGLVMDIQVQGVQVNSGVPAQTFTAQ